MLRNAYIYIASFLIKKKYVMFFLNLTLLHVYYAMIAGIKQK